MTGDMELDQWRADWQTLNVATPDVRSMRAVGEAREDIARTHAVFLDDAIRQLRFRFWRGAERSFLADLRQYPGDDEVRLQGWPRRRRKKFKGGLNA
jgi:hypothetical protein